MAPGEQRDDHAAHGLGHTDHHGIQGIFEREGALPPVREQVVGGHGGKERVAPGDEGLWGSIQPKSPYAMCHVPLASVVTPTVLLSAPRYFMMKGRVPFVWRWAKFSFHCVLSRAWVAFFFSEQEVPPPTNCSSSSRH